MNRSAIVLTLTGAGLLLFASTANARGNVEAGAGQGPIFDLGAALESLETIMNRTTQAAATVAAPAPAPDTAARNVAAFLAMIRQAEGTEARGRDPYRVCYGYRHTIGNFRDHPSITGEWRGERLSDAMCRNAGFGPGCISSAAGAYQIIRGTWVSLRDALALPDFGPASQDRAAVELVRRRGALADVQAGRFADAVHKCRNEWASLPGNTFQQGAKSLPTVTAWYVQNGGTIA
jgi:lysozyme